MKNTLTDSYQDETGQWWYLRKGVRQRAKVRVCKTCGEQFLGYPSSEADYCSSTCYRKRCTRCGNEFHAKTVRQIYCSDACKRGMAVCKKCGSRFIPSKNAAGLFCSKKCAYEFSCPVGAVRDAGNGYKIVKVPAGTPGAKRKYGLNGNQWMLEHRYVMQCVLKRALKPRENVHHLNGDRADNRAENLELWEKTQPCGVRVSDIGGCYEEHF